MFVRRLEERVACFVEQLKPLALANRVVAECGDARLGKADGDLLLCCLAATDMQLFASSSTNSFHLCKLKQFIVVFLLIATQTSSLGVCGLITI